MIDHDADTPDIETRVIDATDPGDLFDVIVHLLGQTDTSTRAAVITGLAVKMAAELDVYGLSIDRYF